MQRPTMQSMSSRCLDGVRSSTRPPHRALSSWTTMRPARTRWGMVSCQASPKTSSSASARPLDSSREIAWCREQEASQAHPLVIDPYAAALVATGSQSPTEATARTRHVIATRYLDEVLLNAMAATSVNSIAQGDYRQVVLLGDGMDTRPFRLPWPPGTILFLVAASECHELAEAVLRQAGAAVPRGCMLRRVNADLQRPGASFAQELESKGFRPDRLSVWALQGLSGLALGSEEMNGLLTDVTNLAAFNSLVIGELPALRRGAAENLLAEFGLLGTTVPLDRLEAGYRTEESSTEADVEPPPGASREECSTAIEASKPGPAEHEGTAESENDAADNLPQPWLFSSQQRRLSLVQMGVYEEHLNEYENLDEDFTDNFS